MYYFTISTSNTLYYGCRNFWYHMQFKCIPPLGSDELMYFISRSIFWWIGRLSPFFGVGAVGVRPHLPICANHDLPAPRHRLLGKFLSLLFCCCAGEQCSVALFFSATEISFFLHFWRHLFVFSFNEVYGSCCALSLHVFCLHGFCSELPSVCSTS